MATNLTLYKNILKNDSKNSRFLFKSLNVKSEEEFVEKSKNLTDSDLNALYNKYTNSTLRLILYHINKNRIDKINFKEKIKDENKTIDQTIQGNFKEFCSIISDILNNTQNIQLLKALLLCMATSMRTNEIKQLTFKMLHKLMNDEFINLKIKKRINNVRIYINKAIILEHIDLFLDESDKHIITISTSSLKKHLRSEILTRIKSRNMNPYLLSLNYGFNFIRKMTLSKMLESFDYTIVSKFAKHKNANTTKEYYNVKNPDWPITNNFVKFL